MWRGRRRSRTPDLLIFNLLIPLTDQHRGLVHPFEKFDAWMREAVGRFGGLTRTGVALEGYWFDPALPAGAEPVRDRSNAYKIDVPPARVPELRAFVERTARDFGQKCLYFERAGEADFVWDPRWRPRSEDG